jgi:hypothetical protein
VEERDGRRENAERWIIRIVVGVGVAVALCTALKLDEPESLPAVALGQEAIYRAELLLLLV